MSANGKGKGTVHRMPGVRCALYAEGHCLYEERLNPEFEAAWRCTELLRYTAMYDQLLDQAERFSLTGDAMQGLWEKRIASAGPPGSGCDCYAPRRTGCPGCGGCGGGKDGNADGTASQEAGSGNVGMEFVAALDCRYAERVSCVLRMPVCDGMCERFVLRAD